ncbi:hypothetical protein C9374_002779 [Naegleria lovaniensis]|uniref:Uncharacterized protein n=1 Tax=Naegleria lovaniensis TaxID=51637 RepID=A0AA88KL32_NAELO|nr:uncharacterized protein C9374_002779 [Naegleria lovaniensis]KAG2386333.1 hypothetical protein C9374_002779 [Naegleria lovaniensis]
MFSQSKTRLYVKHDGRVFESILQDPNDHFTKLVCEGTTAIGATAQGHVYICSKTTKPELIESCQEFKEDTTKIKFLLAGFYHFIVIKESNRVYAAGDQNYVGGIIEAEEGDRNYLRRVNTAMIKGTITHAACGTYSTVVVADETKVYVNGKLGKNTNQFERLQFNKQVSRISAGYDHMIIMCKDGTVYGLGTNGYKQLLDIDHQVHDSLVQLIPPFTHVLDCTAIRLSHITCWVTPTVVHVYGYFGDLGRQMLNFGAITQNGSHHVTIDREKLGNDFNISGAYTSLTFFDKKHRKLIGGGGSSNLKEFSKLDLIDEMFAKALDKQSLYDNLDDTLLDVSIGSDIVALLIGYDFDKVGSFTKKNLLKMCHRCTGSNDDSNSIVPFSDVYLNF